MRQTHALTLKKKNIEKANIKLPRANQSVLFIHEYMSVLRFAEMQRASRLKRELQMLSTEPPPGITCWQTLERIDDLRARKRLQGLETKTTNISRQHSACTAVKRQVECVLSAGSCMILFRWFTEIVGGPETPYEGGIFTLEIKVPERYFL